MHNPKDAKGGCSASLVDAMEQLAALSSPEEVVAFRPSPSLQNRISDLLEKNREEGLTPEEEHEWQEYERVEHLVRIAKAEAMLKLKSSESS